MWLILKKETLLPLTLELEGIRQYYVECFTHFTQPKRLYQVFYDLATRNHFY